jgi:hypothetical protein
MNLISKSKPSPRLETIEHTNRKLQQRLRFILMAYVGVVMTSPAFAQLVEGENTANWFLALFSPALCLALLTIVLIVTGLLLWMGKLAGRTFGLIMGGSILVFGGRTIAPKIIAIFS